MKEKGPFEGIEEEIGIARFINCGDCPPKKLF